MEETFALLNKHGLLLTDAGGGERVDGLTDAWRTLSALVRRWRHVMTRVLAC